jgi:hypothetical protein
MMRYFIAALIIFLISGFLCGSWRKTFVLPWIVVTIPVLIGAGLANLGWIPSLIAPWSDKTHTLVIAGTIALWAGGFTLDNVRSQLTVASNDIHWDERMLLRILFFTTGIALMANAAQFLIAGQVPLFSADPDHARMEAGKIGYIHIFSVLSGHIIPIAALILFTGNNLCKKTRRLLVGIIVVNFALLLLWVARGMLIYPVVTVIAMNYILDKNSFGFKKILVTAVICLVIVSGLKYMRDVTRFGFDYDATGKHASTTGIEHGILGNAAVLYLTITLNYEILNRYTSAVPLLAPHSDGRLMAGNLTSYLPGSGVPYTELNFQNALLKKHDKSLTLTSTFFGIPYLDFGLPGVLVISFLVGLFYRLVWLRMIRYGSPWSIFLYGYLISMAVFIPYAFIYTQVSFTWFILSSFPIIYLCSCRAEGASIFHQKSRIRFQQFNAGESP